MARVKREKNDETPREFGADEYHPDSLPPEVWHDVVGVGTPPTELLAPSGEDLTGRTRLYRASMMGMCETALAAHAAGIMPAEMPEKLLPRLEESSGLEAVVLARYYQMNPSLRPATYPDLVRLKERGVVSGYEAREQQIQVSKVFGRAEVRGHLDSLAHVNGTDSWILVEAKALGPDLWKQFVKGGLAATRYEWQVSALMLCSGLPLDFVVGEKITLPNGEMGIGEVGVETVWTPPIEPAIFKAKLLAADKAALASLQGKGDLPDCYEGNWPCPYHFLPQHKEKQEPKRAHAFDDADLREMLRLYQYHTNNEKVAAKGKKEAKEAIREWLDEHSIMDGETVHEVESGQQVKWVVREMPERVLPAGSQSYPTVKSTRTESLPN